jgi:YidC/Oxa1 family membrane protein insertase
MAALFNSYLYQPILSLLIFIYEHFSFGDLGVAIVVLTVIVRVVLLPLFYKGTKDQTLMARLQPKIKAIQTEHKDNKERQAAELMALYKEHKLNPFSGILLLIVQLPIFIALFQIFRTELGTAVFVTHSFLGVVDLSAKSVGVVLIAAILQFVQAKLALPPEQKDPEGAKKNPLAAMGKTMLYIGPIISAVVLWNLPSALGLYWVISTIFSVGQQAFINHRLAVRVPKEPAR